MITATQARDTRRCHPRHWAALGEDAARVSAVVEETLRYDPPVQLMGRIAADDMTIGDTAVAKGDMMMLLLAAAQRDPAAYDQPDEFMPDRESIRHLGFGKGAHFCLGAPLARLEAAIALSAVTARFPRAAWDVDAAGGRLELHLRQHSGGRRADQRRR